MIPVPDLAALTGARNAKMVLAGDTAQVQPVGNGAATSLRAVALPPPARRAAPPGERRPEVG